MGKLGKIELIEGDYFNKGENHVSQFFQSLFQHFSLLSWLSDQWEIIIKDQQNYKIGKYFVKVYTFCAFRQQTVHYLVQFNKCYDSKTIQYSILEFIDKSEINQKWRRRLQQQKNITVTIKKDVQKSKPIVNKEGKSGQPAERSVITIDIQEQVYEQKKKLSRWKWTTNGLKKNLRLKKKDLKVNQLQYFYKEPLSSRYKQIQNCHFSLAFQGGGAKGVSYVGVYKALKDLHKEVPIGSIIGSSAGGILALAISTEMNPDDITQLCLKMNTIPEDKYYKNESEIDDDEQKKFDQIIENIRSVLHNNGILQCTLFDQIRDALSEFQTGKKILKVLECINPSIAQLFSLELNKKDASDKNKKKQFRFNYYGLLKAGMMKGNAVQDIAAHCIIDYFSKHFNKVYFQLNLSQPYPTNQQKLERKKKISNILLGWGIDPDQINSKIQLKLLLEKQQNMDKLKTIRLKEFYDITGVQFTCTSVDLDDKILRFFNHKTTPNLPVCKTVQMTGSFPVAFAAQQWKKQWGKYYIHYTNTRKQIDLTGHTFTDGGLLANFPIKYLDNEMMRPMYFSHKKHPRHTILYGFGLDEIETKLQETKAKQAEKEKSEAISQLVSHIFSKFSKCTLFCNLLGSNSKEQLKKVSLQQIPVLNFLIKLYSTFYVADYNLNIQCFQKCMIVTEVEESVEQNQKIVQKEIQKYEEINKNIQVLFKSSQKLKDANPFKILAESCTKIEESLDQFESTDNICVQRIKTKILRSLCSYQGARIKLLNQNCVGINAFIKFLEEVYDFEFFRMQSNSSNKTKIKQTVDQIKSYFNKKEKIKAKKEQVQLIYKSIIQNQLDLIDIVKKKIDKILDYLRKKNPKGSINKVEYLQKAHVKYDLILELADMENKFFMTDEPQVKRAMQNILGCNYSYGLPIVKAQNYIMENLAQIQAQINSIVCKGPHKKIHLVLQSKDNSHLYFCGLYQILQNVLSRQQNHQKSIEMITSSGFHSVFSFLLAGGKKIANIRKEMWKIKELICFEQDIIKQFDSYAWTKTSSRNMHQLLDTTWTNHYEIFGEMQQYILKQGGDPKLSEEIKQIRKQFLNSKEVITEKMEQILDYVSKSCYEAMKQKTPESQKKKLAKLLALSDKRKDKDYRKKSSAISEGTKRMMKIVMTHFEAVLRELVLGTLFINTNFDFSNPRISEQAWKGIFIKRLLSSKRLEEYIKNMLVQMNLNVNTTLSQFYEFGYRKITLNFALINKNKQRIELFNKFTRPNLPIWAAIVASTSLPYLFPAVNFEKEWQYCPYANSRMRKLVNHFFNADQTDKLQQSYFSANFVSSLPLELLTNLKIAEQNYKDPRQKEKHLIQQNDMRKNDFTTDDIQLVPKQKATQFTFLTFAFKIKKNINEKQISKEKKEKNFINLSNALNIFVDFKMGRFQNVQVGFKDILKRLGILNNIQIRIQSHDNTIMNLYYDQAVKLPISLGTLDFYKIQQGRQQFLHQCFIQSQFIVRGIFQNLQVYEIKKEKNNVGGKDSKEKRFRYKVNYQTYLQLINQQIEVQTSGKTEIKKQIHLSFISKSKQNRKLATMYRVFWSLKNQKFFYQEYLDNQIVIPFDSQKIFFRFDYPDMNTVLKKTNSIVIDLAGIKDIKNKKVYIKFNYAKLAESKLKIQSLEYEKSPSKRLAPIKDKFIKEKSGESFYEEINSFHALIDQKSNQRNPKSIIQQESPQKSKEQYKMYNAHLAAKTLVNYKYNGIICDGCVRPLSRTKKIISNKCSKCKREKVLIGYFCDNQQCLQKDNNIFCFHCLFEFVFSLENGKMKCSQKNHPFQSYSSKKHRNIQVSQNYYNQIQSKNAQMNQNSKNPKKLRQIQRYQEFKICHFCESVAVNYLRDQQCDINLCFKCSTILGSGKA